MMLTASKTNDVGKTRFKNQSFKEIHMKTLIPNRWLRSFAYAFVAFVFTVAIGAGTALAQNTIYVDATNGSNINDGSETLPVATINKGLELLDDGGTLIILGSAYNGADGDGGNLTVQASSNADNDLESLTIQLETGVQSIVTLQDATVEVDIDGELTFLSADGTYLQQESTSLTLTSGNVNIDAESSWRLADNTTISIKEDGAFTGAAPQKAANLSLVYTDADAAAGPEAEYGDYGSGSITVNLSGAGASIDFPASITTTGAFVKTAGDVTLSGDLSVGEFTNTTDDLTVSGKLTTTGDNTHADGDVEVGALEVDADYVVADGDLTVNGNVTLNGGSDFINNNTGDVLVTGDLHATNGSEITLAAAGSLTVEGTVTLDADDVAQTYLAGTPFIGNAAGGDLKIGDLVLTSNDVTADVTSVIFVSNGAGGLVEIGAVTADDVQDAAGNFTMEFEVDLVNGAAGEFVASSGVFRNLVNNGGGEFTIGAATFEGNVSNDNVSSTLTLTADLTVEGVLTNAGTGAGDGILLGSNTLTLDGANAHVTDGGEIKGSGKLYVTGGNNSFNGGTLGNVEVNNADNTTTFENAAIDVNNIEVTAGTLNVIIATTAEGATTVSGGTLDIDGVAFTAEGDFVLSSGAADLDATAVLNIESDFTRTAGTFTADAGSELAFNGAAPQSISVGDNFQVANVTFDNNGGIITVNRSIRSEGDAEITAGTSVDFQGFNLIMNGDGGSLAINGDYTNTTTGGVYIGGVDGALNKVVQGGDALPTSFDITGDGEFGNLFIAAGSGNTPTVGLNAVTALTFTDQLVLISGTLNVDGTNYASDLSPVGDDAVVVVYPASTDGVDEVAGGTFNGLNNNYDLEYRGALAGAETIGSELTPEVVNVTVSTTDDVLNLPNVSPVTIKGNLTINDGATLVGDGAAQDLEVEGSLLVKEGAILIDGGAALTIKLEEDDVDHEVYGLIDDTGAGVVLELSGDNLTVSGSGSFVASNNIINAAVAVGGADVSISGIQEIQQAVTIDDASDASLTLALIDRDDTDPAISTGLVTGGIVVDNAGGGDATLVLASDVDVTGGAITVGADGSVYFDTFDLNVDNATVLTGHADASYASNGGYLVAESGGNIDADGADVPYVKLEAASVLVSDLEVSGKLIAEANLTGGQLLTISGDADLFADVTNDVDLTGDDATIDLGDANRIVTGNLQVDSDGTVTLANDGTTRILTVAAGSDYIHTDGTFYLADNNLYINDNLVYVEGTLAMTDGYVWLDNATIDTDDNNLEIANLRIVNGSEIATAAGDDDEVTVTSNLILKSGTFDIDNSGAADASRLHIGDGVTIERQNNAAVLNTAPHFGDAVHLVYTTTAGITTGPEVPATDIVQDVNVQVDVTMDDDIIVNGTLTLVGDLDIVDEALSVADGGKVIMNGGNLAVGAGSFSADEYEVVYQQVYTTDIELVSGNVSVEVNGVPAGSITVTLDADYTFANLEVADGDVLDIDDYTLTFVGDFTATSAGVIVGTAGTGNLSFAGTELQAIAVPSDGLTLGVDVTLDNPAGAELTGGNLTVNNSNFHFVDGLLRTGDNQLVLTHTSTSNQGFTRSGDSYVVGKVTKTLPSTGTASNRVEFPVGGEFENGASAYAPVSFTFNQPSAIPSGITMTATHSEVDPDNALAELGSNGFPVPDGVEPGVDLARYPDRFKWNVKTSSPLSPSLVYDMELERENYSEYTTTGVTADVEDMRIIRRSADHVDNPWRLQGDADEYLQSYQSGTFPDIHPTVIVQSVQGGIRAGNGTIFTYALKSNLEATQPADIVANAGQERDVVLRHSLLHTDGVFKGGTGTYTYDISGYDDDVATYSIDADTLTIHAVSPGTTTFNIGVTDALNDTEATIVNITVEPALMAGELDDVTLNLTDTYVVDVTGLFTGGASPIDIVVASDDTDVVTADIDGMDVELTTTGVGTATVSVTGTDQTGASETVEFDVTVNATFVAVGTIDDETLRAGDDYQQDAEYVEIDLADFFDGGSGEAAFEVSAADEDVVHASIDDDNILTVTVLSSSIEPEAVTVTVTGTDEIGAVVTQVFDVTAVPAYGDVNADGLVSSFDATQILRFNVGDVEFNAVQEYVANVKQSGDVSSFDAAIILQYAARMEGVTIPFDASAKSIGSGSLAWGDMTRNEEEGTVSVPLMLSSEGAGVYSLDIQGIYDLNQASIERVEFAELPEGWITARSDIEDGEFRLALAGATPARNGQIATVVFKLEDASSSAGIQARGFVNESRYELEKMEIVEIPDEFALNQNYPNPFNPTTNITYQLPAAADVTIEVYNSIGQRVLTLVDQNMNAGTHTVNADLSNLSSGMYIYRIVAQSENETFSTTRKMTLIK
ncbi:T9SS type A sorting domain-containing protein [Balneolales bacterium ANBcel1]|nr:T9SS type A sorting domain-containing protein [Balneolales bacterium ANBcel1]